MKPYLLEACTDSVESALEAAEGGAHRLELCANLIIGGTTPGVSQFKQIRKSLELPIHVLLRPRYGDFYYTEREFQMIREDAAMFIQLGADGIVAGCLTPEGNLDRERMEILRETAKSRHFTLHRAFDMCQCPYRALEDAVSIGADTILTSGQQNSCLEGKALLKELIRLAGSRINILVGSGVNARTIPSLAKETGARQFHMSGKTMVDSGMVYRKENVSMGIGPIGEYAIVRTDKVQIREAVNALNRLFP